MHQSQLGSVNLPRQWAVYYATYGLVPIPVKERSKVPDLGQGWDKQTNVQSNIAKFKPAHNIGINLGASGALTDIDLDCDEACLLASNFLPKTTGVFGREKWTPKLGQVDKCIFC